MNKNPTNKLLHAYGETKILHPDEWTKERTYYALGCCKKWIGNILPSELLSREMKQAIESIVTLSESNIFYDKFPNNIETPNYGDSYNKGPFEENSIYGIKLNAGYSDNIISYNIADKISPEEQLRAFNDLAHFRGIKTGFRTVISADQIKVAHKNGEDETFSWSDENHVELYIQESVKLMNLGFECMFIDSAKHIGGYDCENYTGVGDLPEYHQMQYILNEIRSRSGKTTISFVGEKSTDDFERYQNMGLNAGTDFITGDDFYAVRELSENLKYNRIYAAGVEVENDNYEGGISYEQRLNRINTALFGFYQASDKLPSFMQMNDIFPLRYDTNTHHIMMTNPSYSIDGSPISHWENLFTKDDGRFYNHKVAELFAHALCL